MTIEEYEAHKAQCRRKDERSDTAAFLLSKLPAIIAFLFVLALIL